MKQESERRRRAHREATAAELNYKFNKGRNIYANAEEKTRMEKLNPLLVEQMKNFIDKIPSMQKNKALEVACGECMVSRDILIDRFFEIDLIDQSDGAIEHANTLKVKCPKIRNIHTY